LERQVKYVNKISRNTKLRKEKSIVESDVDIINGSDVELINESLPFEMNNKQENFNWEDIGVFLNFDDSYSCATYS
jgi:hypothetical protein